MGKKHVVAQGESLASIAHRYGFAEWTKLYEHPDNAGLKQKRKNPDTLEPGDEVAIPDPEAKKVACATGKVHRFRKKGSTVTFRLRLKDGRGEALADMDYRLVAAGQVFEGTTDGEGLVEQEVPARTSVVQVEVPAFELRVTAQVGHLDPLETLGGAQARLANLGYLAACAEGTLDDATERALRAFQRDAGVDESGAYDDATRTKLAERHGS